VAALAVLDVRVFKQVLGVAVELTALVAAAAEELSLLVVLVLDLLGLAAAVVV